MVSRPKQFLLLLIPNNEREHSPQMLQYSLTPLFVSVKDNLGVALTFKLMSRGSPVQLRGELLGDERGDLCWRAVVCVDDEVVRRELMEFSR